MSRAISNSLTFSRDNENPLGQNPSVLSGKMKFQTKRTKLPPHSAFRLAFIVPVILFAVAAARAADWQPDPGFTSLYNGKDLTGWHYKDGPAFDGQAEASDGRYSADGEILTVHPHDPAKGPRLRQLWTTEKFPGDFTLKLQFRAAINSDSGVFLREPQLQCRDYLVAGPYKKLKNYKPQDWNDLVITVRDNLAHCECNGEVLEDALKLPETGPIGLEADRGQMEYRHLEIQPSAAAKP